MRPNRVKDGVVLCAISGGHAKASSGWRKPRMVSDWLVFDAHIVDETWSYPEDREKQEKQQHGESHYPASCSAEIQQGRNCQEDQWRDVCEIDGRSKRILDQCTYRHHGEREHQPLSGQQPSRSCRRPRERGRADYDKTGYGLIEHLPTELVSESTLLRHENSYEDKAQAKKR